MEMQELVKILEEYLKDNFNEDTLKVFRQLWGKANVSEFDIAENLKLSINYVRNLLYGLHARNFVNSTRKKDRQKGWYIYYWTFNIKHAVDVIITRKKEKLRQLEKQLRLGKEEYYACKDGHVEFNAVKALEYGFKCPECEQVLIREASEHNIEMVNKEIAAINKEIEILQLPVEMPKEVRPRKVRAVGKKKISIKKKARKARKKLKIVKKKIRKLKKKLKKAGAEKKGKIARKIKKLRIKRGIIKKKIKKLKKKRLSLKKERILRKKGLSPRGARRGSREKKSFWEDRKIISSKKEILGKAKESLFLSRKKNPREKEREKVREKKDKKGSLFGLLKRRVGF